MANFSVLSKYEEQLLRLEQAPPQKSASQEP